MCITDNYHETVPMTLEHALLGSFPFLLAIDYPDSSLLRTRTGPCCYFLHRVFKFSQSHHGAVADNETSEVNRRRVHHNRHFHAAASCRYGKDILL